MKKILLFTTTNCTHCPGAKEHLNNIGVEYDIIDASTNIEMRSKYRVMSAPTLIIDDGNVKRYGGNDILKLGKEDVL